MAASWLATCASHENCPPQAAVPLPTRLIEIPQEGQECKLHISASGEKGQYVTLSHCWGPGGIKFLLTTANIEQLQGTIHTEILPRSFHDAIIITRRLGFRFLWIDAICIMQDSVEDWAHESSHMAEIYRNGILMISAVAGPDSDYGILRPRDILQSHRFGEHKEFVFQTGIHLSGTMDEDAPLHHRGWCLQERIMAPRILHFGRKQLTWECVNGYWAECRGLADIPMGGEIREARASAMPFIWPLASKVLGFPSPRLEEDRAQVGRLTAFYNCVSVFTARKLTKRSDKLPAFSGLASAFQTLELGAYLAGLWEKDLAYGLNWRARHQEPDEGQPDSVEYIAPSWSWASLAVHCKVRDVRNYLTRGSKWEADFEHFNHTVKPQLLSHHIDLATSDPYGRISAASITLRGFSRPVLVWTDRTHMGWPNAAYLDRAGAWGPSTIDDGCLWMFGPPHEYIPWPVYEDQDAPSATDKNKAMRFEALLVGMAHPQINNPSMISTMLLLDPVESLKDIYRRVGLVELIAPGEMDPARWEEKDLTLI